MVIPVLTIVSSPDVTADTKSTTVKRSIIRKTQLKYHVENELDFPGQINKITVI